MGTSTRAQLEKGFQEPQNPQLPSTLPWPFPPGLSLPAPSQSQNATEHQIQPQFLSTQSPTLPSLPRPRLIRSHSVMGTAVPPLKGLEEFSQPSIAGPLHQVHQMQLDTNQEEAAPVEEFNFETTTPLEGHNNSHNDCQWESAQPVQQQGETSSPQEDQQRRADATDRDKGFVQSWYAAADQQQTTAFRENPILGSCYVPTVGGSYAAVTLESNYGSSQEKDDWWPPAIQSQEEQDSALEELQAIASALEETYTQVPDNCSTENPHNSEVEGHINILDQDIPRMRLLF